MPMTLSRMQNGLFLAVRRVDSNASLIPYGITLLRVTLALLWMVHWWYKIGHDGMPATEKLFVSLGYPAWTAWADVLFEFVAFLLLLVGMRVRIVSILLLVLLIPATAVWIPKGFFFINGGYEFPLVWCVLQLVQALLGPGALSMAAVSSERSFNSIHDSDRSNETR